MKIFIRIIPRIFLLLGVAGCGHSPCAPERADPIGIGEFKGDKISPEFFGDGSVRCTGEGLVDHGFSGGMDRHAKIEYLGKIKAESIDYSIYYFSHVDNHGSFRILILESGCEYFGSYAIEDRPIRISGKDIVFDAPERLGNVIHFTGISPPARVIINGSQAIFGL